MVKGPLCQTVKSTNCAVRVFTEWYQERNKKENNKCCVNLLESMPTAQLLNKWLARFVLEVSSINQLLHGLLRHTRLHWKDCPHFLDKQNTAFSVHLRHVTTDFVPLYSKISRPRNEYIEGGTALFVACVLKNNLSTICYYY